jgi:type I restriction enzyme, S subunit
MDTKALRQKILDLAIHGRLVAQDPNDEPASTLLQQICEEKQRLIKEGKVKKGKKTEETSHDEDVPFEVPEGWVWTRLGEICHGITAGGDKPDIYSKTKTKDCTIPIYSNGIENDGLYGFTDSAKIFKDCITVSARGTIGHVCIRTEPFVPIVRLITIIPDVLVDIKFLSYYLRQSLKEGEGSSIPQLTVPNVCHSYVPLPPLTEQRRIVAEIERWFGLIDIIESGKESLKSAVKQAKAKILDLAIHGRLVPQDPNDEPASTLLQRINPKAEIVEDNDEYGDVPKGWCVTRLGEISDYGKCENVQVEDIDGQDWVLELEDIEKDTAKIIQRLTKSERSINGVRHKFHKGDILYSKLRTYLNKVLVAPEDGYCTTEIIPFTSAISNDYICQVLRSPYFLDYTAQCGYGVKMPRLSTNDARKAIIPLPPLPEQHRIVAKIEELFVLLDKIESSL